MDYVDADWGSGLIDRKSYTGFAFTLSHAVISWKSQRQSTVALSSTEAQYMAATEAVKEAKYWSNYMEELQLRRLLSVEVFNYNQGARLLAHNPILHHRTKHIELRHHYIKEIIREGRIKLNYLNTNEMVADVLTKPLPGPKHQLFSYGLGLRSLY